MAARLVLVMAAMVAICGPAWASQKLAIFPIDMSMPKSEEDFFSGVTGPTEAEKARLAMAEAEFTKRLGDDARYEVVDLSTLNDDIQAARPIYECNGCEVDIAAKVKADLAMTSVIEKISETHLSLTVALIDVAQTKLVRNVSVLIQGNTDEAWLHGVRWLLKNRLLAKDDAK